VHGPGSWTSKLRHLVRELETAENDPTAGRAAEVTVLVDGPYGTPVAHARYDAVLLLAAGIGVTPHVAQYQHLRALHRAGARDVPQTRLVWAAREAALFGVFRSVLSAGGDDPEDRDKFTYALFLTAGGANDEAAADDVVLGRPNLGLEIDRLRPLGRRALVVASGPEGFVDAVRHLTGICGVDLRREVFEL